MSTPSIAWPRRREHRPAAEDDTPGVDDEYSAVRETHPTTEGRFELSVERRIAAPAAVVWRVMTEQLEDRFRPRPWRAEVRELRWHPGGRSAIIMHGPGGEAVPNDGCVLTDAFTAGWLPAGPFMVGVFEIEPRGRRDAPPRLGPPPVARGAGTARQDGTEAGWAAAADRLDALADAVA